MNLEISYVSFSLCCSQGHSTAVLSICPHPSNSDLVYTASAKEIVCWDLATPGDLGPRIIDRWSLDDAMKASKLQLGGKNAARFNWRIVSMALPPGGTALLTLSKVKATRIGDGGPSTSTTENDRAAVKGPPGRLAVLHLRQRKLLELKKPVKLSRVDKLATARVHQQAVNKPSSFRFALVDRNTLHMGRSDSYVVEGCEAVTHTRNLTVAAAAHRSQRAAAGDVSGRVMVFTQKKGVPRSAPANDRYAVTTHHWHAQEVTALCFSEDDKFLLSGGHEEVLVVWQVEDGKRTYLPRLGGSVNHIVRSPIDPAKFLVSLSCNAIITINIATMQIDTRIAGVYPFSTTALESPLAVSSRLAQWTGRVPGSEYIAMPADKGRVQIVDWTSGRAVGVFQAGPKPSISAKEMKKGSPLLHEGAVLGLAVGGAKGQYLCTVTAGPLETEGIIRNVPDVTGGRFFSVKFWRKGAPGGGTLAPQYEVVTSVDGAHRAAVTAVAFAPPAVGRRNRCVTASLDGTFKVWQESETSLPMVKPIPRGARALKEMAAAGGPPPPEMIKGWSLLCTGSHRQEPITSCTFSRDGSVMYLGTARGLLTMWDPETNELLGEAALPSRIKIKRLECVSGIGGVGGQELVIGIGMDYEFFCYDPTWGGFRWHMNMGRCRWSLKGIVRDVDGAGRIICESRVRGMLLSLEGAKGHLLSKGNLLLPRGHAAAAVLPLAFSARGRKGLRKTRKAGPKAVKGKAKRGKTATRARGAKKASKATARKTTRRAVGRRTRRSARLQQKVHKPKAAKPSKRTRPARPTAPRRGGADVVVISHAGEMASTRAPPVPAAPIPRAQLLPPRILSKRQQKRQQKSTQRQVKERAVTMARVPAELVKAVASLSSQQQYMGRAVKDLSADLLKMLNM